MPLPNSVRVFATALAVAALLTACGGDDDDKPSTPTDPAPGAEQPSPAKPELRCAP